MAWHTPLNLLGSATEQGSGGKQKRRDVVVLILETVVATDKLSLEGFESKDMV